MTAVEVRRVPGQRTRVGTDAVAAVLRIRAHVAVNDRRFPVTVHKYGLQAGAGARDARYERRLAQYPAFTHVVNPRAVCRNGDVFVPLVAKDVHGVNGNLVILCKRRAAFPRTDPAFIGIDRFARLLPVPIDRHCRAGLGREGDLRISHHHRLPRQLRRGIHRPEDAPGTPLAGAQAVGIARSQRNDRADFVYVAVLAEEAEGNLARLVQLQDHLLAVFLLLELPGAQHKILRFAGDGSAQICALHDGILLSRNIPGLIKFNLQLIARRSANRNGQLLRLSRCILIDQHADVAFRQTVGAQIHGRPTVHPELIGLVPGIDLHRLALLEIVQAHIHILRRFQNQLRFILRQFRPDRQIDGRGFRFHRRYIGLRRRRVGLRRRRVGLRRRRVGLRGRRVGLRGRRVGLRERRVGLRGRHILADESRHDFGLGFRGREQPQKREHRQSQRTCSAGADEQQALFGHAALARFRLRMRPIQVGAQRVLHLLHVGIPILGLKGQALEYDLHQRAVHTLDRRDALLAGDPAKAGLAALLRIIRTRGGHEGQSALVEQLIDDERQ